MNEQYFVSETVEFMKFRITTENYIVLYKCSIYVMCAYACVLARVHIYVVAYKFFKFCMDIKNLFLFLIELLFTYASININLYNSRYYCKYK